MSAVLKLAEELERACGVWPMPGAPPMPRPDAFARRIREAAAKDAAELERLRNGVRRIAEMLDRRRQMGADQVSARSVAGDLLNVVNGDAQ